MKKVIILIFFIGLHNIGLPQETPVSGIIPSSAPAFTVLGISPAEISKPNNWNALQTGLYHSLLSEKGAVPTNLSLEFYPYWLKDHPHFTYNNYLDGNGFSFRNLAISLASAKTIYGKDSAQSMGVGFRLPVMTGNKRNISKLKSDLKAFIDKKREQSTTWQSAFILYIINYATLKPGNTVAQFISDVKANIINPVKPFVLWRDHHAEVVQVISDTLEPVLTGKDNDAFSAHATELQMLASEYFNIHNVSSAEAITEEISAALKDVSNLEFSGALAVAFPGNQFNNAHTSRLAVWGDYSFGVSKNGKVDGTVALRYIRDFKVDTIAFANNLDGILRLNLAIGNKQKFMLSVLGVLRLKSTSVEKFLNNNKYYIIKNETDNKFTLDISYKITSQLALSYSFGKNYGKTAFSLPNQLINFLNLFYSVNTKTYKTDKNEFGFKSF
ncbi:MAG TPA: hypothetical protein VMY77_05700 [Chitinophagaceae bacterium]|nr:hypothetical protein [Chitinophagaceae bacterium]